MTKHFANEAAARESVQKKEIYGYLSIPPQFEQDAITGKNATLSYYYHYALMSVGGELMAAFETSLAPVALFPCGDASDGSRSRTESDYHLFITSAG